MHVRSSSVPGAPSPAMHASFMEQLQFMRYTLRIMANWGKRFSAAGMEGISVLCGGRE